MLLGTPKKVLLLTDLSFGKIMNCFVSVLIFIAIVSKNYMNRQLAKSFHHGNMKEPFLR